MHFFTVNKDYIKAIKKEDSHIIMSTHLIGTVLRLHESIYFLPVLPLDKSDFDEQGNIRKSSPTIMRMYQLEEDEYLGKCLFSNMFSVPYKEINMIDLSQYDYKTNQLLEKTLKYINQNQARIEKNAERIYKQKIKNYQQQYLDMTVDFKKLEEFCICWEIEKYGKHYNRFPDPSYFLVNPNSLGITNYDLMNKDKKVANISIDNETQKIIKINQIYNQEYAPLECFHQHQLDEKHITEWFKGRGIPSWRDGLDYLLDNLGIKNRDILLNKAYGLSLSDQYWMNPEDTPLDWNKINFFDNDFDSHDYLQATFENQLLNEYEVNFFTPNNTSDGMLKKAWIVGEDKKRYLIKGSFHQQEMEPFNEVLGSMICEVIHLPYVHYSIDYIHHIVVSKCENFITKDTELISAYAILKYEDVNMKDDYHKVLETYINILENNGIKDVSVKLSKMYILDYLMMNQDRHLGNFGIIRNVNDLSWIDVAPNYDSGQSMYSQSPIYEMNFENGYGCFFNNKKLSFQEILEIMKPYIHYSIDYDKLYKVADEWKQLLEKHKHKMSITDEKIDCLYEGLKLRIQLLEKELNDKNN